MNVKGHGDRKVTLFIGCAALVSMIGILAWVIVTQPMLGRGPTSVTPVIDPLRLERHTRVLSEEFVPRDWRHPENLGRVAAYIRDEFAAAGGAVEDQPYPMDEETYRNVIGVFGPGTDSRIVVGAHYDAFGEFPGADDNASGVAGLIELAHLLGSADLGRQVELVAFTLEEPKTADGDGLFRSEYGGSAVYVRSLLDENASIRVFLNLEMIGYFNDQPDSQSFPIGLLNWLYPSQGNFVTIIGRIGQGRVVRQVKRAMRSAAGLPVYSMSAHEWVEGVDWSDHANFWAAGHEAVMITDTSFFRNKAYHTAEDGADRLDYERMAEVVLGVYAAVMAFSDEEEAR